MPAIDEHVSRAPQVPAEEREVAERFLRDDSQLIRQRPEQDRNVVDALVIGDEDIRPARLEPLEPVDRRRGHRSSPGSAATTCARTSARSGRCARTGWTRSTACPARSCTRRWPGSGRRPSATSETEESSECRMQNAECRCQLERPPSEFCILNSDLLSCSRRRRRHLRTRTAAGVGVGGHDVGRRRRLRTPDSMKRPKIILPAVV